VLQHSGGALWFLRLFLAASALPVVFLHEFRDAGGLMFGPQPYVGNNAFALEDQLAAFNLAGPHPAVERVPGDSQVFRELYRRVSLHARKYNTGVSCSQGV
jgi:hypothetical protein